jgi:hypothetical protein
MESKPLTVCPKCEKTFYNKGNYTICFPCQPKCDCGNILKPPFKKCYDCSQMTKKDVCTGCKQFFDGKGEYTTCYECNQHAKKDKCIDCKEPFDGKGEYKKCYGCSKGNKK